MRCCVALLLLCLASPAFGQVKAKIIGPDEAKCCELVELVAEISGDSGELRLRPRPAKLRERTNSDGQRCYLFVPCDQVEKYEAELIVWGIVDGKVQSASDFHEVKITGKPEPKPPTPPNPGPEPGPNPPPPMPPTPPGPNPPAPNPGPEDGRFGVAKLAFNAGKSVNRPAECAALATAFRNAAKETRDKDLGVLSILSLLRRETGKAIPDSSRGYWESANSVLSSKLKSLYGDGRLGGSKDWADCFDEVAIGLEAASK